MEFTGIIQSIGETELIGEKETPKKTVVLKEDKEDYPSSLAVDFRGQKVDLLNGNGEGDKVTVTLNSKTREHNGRYFNSISVWKLIKHNAIDKDDGDIPLPF